MTCLGGPAGLWRHSPPTGPPLCGLIRIVPDVQVQVVACDLKESISPITADNLLWTETQYAMGTTSINTATVDASGGSPRCGSSSVYKRLNDSFHGDIFSTGLSLEPNSIRIETSCTSNLSFNAY